MWKKNCKCRHRNTLLLLWGPARQVEHYCILIIVESIFDVTAACDGKSVKTCSFFFILAKNNADNGQSRCGYLFFTRFTLTRVYIIKYILLLCNDENKNNRANCPTRCCNRLMRRIDGIVYDDNVTFFHRDKSLL